MGQRSDVPLAYHLLLIVVTNKVPSTNLQLAADPAGCSPTEDEGGARTSLTDVNGTDQLSWITGQVILDNNN